MKKYSLFCIALMAIFYIVEIGMLGYAVYFLSENGVKALEIGILLGVSGIVAAIIQPLFGHIADKYDNIDFKNLLTWMGAFVVVLFIGLYCFHNNKMAIMIFFGLLYLLTNTMTPFVNESSFYYSNKGINVNFGIARGFGSLAYAIVSYIIGIYTKVFGARLLSFNGIISSIIFLVIIILMPRVGNQDNKVAENIINTKTTFNNNSNIIKKYPSFFMMVLATILAMSFQNSECGYLIDIIKELGGDSTHLGIAISLAAVVEIPTMFLMTRIMKIINVKKLIAISCAVYIIRSFLFRIPNMTAIYISQLLQMFSFAIITPATVYLADEVMHEEDKNLGQTLIGMAVTIGLILGSYIGGQLISIGGINLLEICCIFIAIFSFIFAFIGNVIKP